MLEAAADKKAEDPVALNLIFTRELKSAVLQIELDVSRHGGGQKHEECKRKSAHISMDQSTAIQVSRRGTRRFL